MKYIRTQNGIITNRLSNCNCFKSRGTTGRYILRSLEDDKDLELWLKYHRTSIFKQADDLKDLCDEIVVDDKTSPNNKPFIYKEDWGKILNQKVGECLNVCVGNGAIYGAIWVFDDNGAPTLKPVAKMNEKGDLELL